MNFWQCRFAQPKIEILCTKYRFLFLALVWIGYVLHTNRVSVAPFFIFWFKRMLCTRRTHYPIATYVLHYRGTLVPAHALYNQMLGINFGNSSYTYTVGFEMRDSGSKFWSHLKFRDGNTYRHGVNVRHPTMGWANERANVYHHAHICSGRSGLWSALGRQSTGYMPWHT